MDNELKTSEKWIVLGVAVVIVLIVSWFFANRPADGPALPGGQEQAPPEGWEWLTYRYPAGLMIDLPSYWVNEGAEERPVFRNTIAAGQTLRLDFISPSQLTDQAVSEIMLGGNVYHYWNRGEEGLYYLQLGDGNYVAFTASQPEGGDLNRILATAAILNLEYRDFVYEDGGISFRLPTSATASGGEFRGPGLHLIVESSPVPDSLAWADYQYCSANRQDEAMIGGRQAAAFYLERGCCDGPGCEQPRIVYSFERAPGRRLDLVFPGLPTLSQTEEALLMSLSFIQ